MPLEYRHSLSPKNPVANSDHPSGKPQNTFSQLPCYRQKKPAFFTIAHSPYVQSTSGRRQSMIPKNTGTLCCRTTQPLILFPLNASLKSHFQNRLANYTKATFFHDRSHTVCPIDFRSIGNRFPSNTGTLCCRTTQPLILFPLTASLKTLYRNSYAKYTKNDVFHDRSPDRMSHRLPVDGNRCLSNAGTL
jgi:hypothetical protein